MLALSLLVRKPEPNMYWGERDGSLDFHIRSEGLPTFIMSFYEKRDGPYVLYARDMGKNYVKHGAFYADESDAAAMFLEDGNSLNWDWVRSKITPRPAAAGA